MYIVVEVVYMLLFCRSGGTVVGGWLEKWSIKLTQLPTKLNLKLKLKPSLAKKPHLYSIQPGTELNALFLS